VQRFAAVLLEMHPAERRACIRPLIALIERVVDGDTDSISASSTQANQDLDPVLRHDWSFLDDAYEFGPR
jgi:hypothetical protein